MFNRLGFPVILLVALLIAVGVQLAPRLAADRQTAPGGGGRGGAGGVGPSSQGIALPLPLLPTGGVTDLPDDIHEEVSRQATGAMMHVVFHETGHMVIDLLKLPSTGPEEDAADEFSMLLLTRAMKTADAHSRDVLREVIWSSATFWKISAVRNSNKRIDWADEHSPDMRRYYNLLCMAVGSDPGYFGGFAKSEGYSDDKIGACVQDYDKKLAAWNVLMTGHVRSAGSGAPQHRLQLEFGPRGPEKYAAFETVFRDGPIKTLLDAVSRSYDLPMSVPVIARSCDGKVNAWWDASSKQLTFCYEMYEYVAESFAVREVAIHRQDPSIPAAGGEPAPEPEVNNAPYDELAALAGHWGCSGTRPDGVAFQQDLLLQPSGQFALAVTSATGRSDAIGNWRMPRPHLVAFSVTDANPPGVFGKGQVIPIRWASEREFQSPYAHCVRQADQ